MTKHRCLVRGAPITAFVQGSEEAQIVIGIRRPSDSPPRFSLAPPGVTINDNWEQNAGITFPGKAMVAATPVPVV